jgi:hypothetical protein
MAVISSETPGNPFSEESNWLMTNQWELEAPAPLFKATTFRAARCSPEDGVRLESRNLGSHGGDYPVEQPSKRLVTIQFYNFLQSMKLSNG